MKRTLLRITILLVVSTLVLTGIFNLPAQFIHAESPIKILQTSTESKFRQSFTFRARVSSSAGKLVDARIHIRLLGTGVSDERVDEVNKFTPAREVDLEYVVDTKNSTTPPWQVLFYSWQIGDDAGNTLRSDPIRTEMADETRKWQTLSDGKVSVYWYGKIPAYGKGLLQVSQYGFAHVSKATGYTPDQELRVVVYNSQTDFCSFWAKGECLDWYGGATFAALTVQWARDAAYDQAYLLRQAIPHELAHAFLNYWLGAYIIQIPDWFNEGQAVNNQIDGIDEELARAQSVVRRGKWIHFGLLGDVRYVQNDPGDPNAEKVRDWYAQATSMVYFLYQEYGLEVLGKIVSKVKDGKRFVPAFKDVTGMTMNDYELAWLRWMGVKVPPTLTPSKTWTPGGPTETPTPSDLTRFAPKKPTATPTGS